MPKRNWVALTSRIVEATGYSEPRNAVSQDWVDWCVARDFLPLILPNNGDVAVETLDTIQPRLVILTGGNDSVPGTSGTDHSEIRNAAEKRILDWVVWHECPTLGVCRGMHMINLHFGGAVRPDLADATELHVATSHPITLFGRLRDLARVEIAETNSYHRQGILRDEVAPGLSPAALCNADGTVEAIAHDSKPIVGIGWHPERPNPATALDDAIVADLMSHPSRKKPNE